MKIKTVTYEEDRLCYFSEQRKIILKRYNRLRRTKSLMIPGSEKLDNQLSDLGREISFYDDIIEMLGKDIKPSKAKTKYEN